MPAMKVIGIDLGTCNSCVGVFHNGAVEILTNNYDLHTTPSVVGFIDGLKVVGKAAKDDMNKNFLNVITCIKRLIGRKFDDKKVKEDMRKLPYKIVSRAGYAAVEVQIDDQPKIYTPEEISALILMEMKKIAVDFLGGDMNDPIGAVITVPAYFNDSQREKTIDAARIAGLTVLRIINEPTAAALAYGYKNRWKEGTLLVYDLGGGTFDVSIIKVTNGCCEVLAVDGDDHLGGEDFDDGIVRNCLRHFLKETGHDIERNSQAICKLKAVCEETKKRLSNQIFCSIEIDDLYDNKDLRIKNYPRTKFDAFAQVIIDNTLDLVKRALKEAKITTDDVDHVILVGGSTKIPLVRSKLSEFFKKNGKNKDLKCDIKSDEAIAYGATLMAEHYNIHMAERGNMLDNNNRTADTSIRNIHLLDVIPRSLGTDLYRSLKDKNGYFNIVAKRNTKFPFEMKSICTTLFKNQDEMDFVVYEGEDPVLTNNNKLGNFTLKNIAPAKAGEPDIEITFKVNENAVLTVSAVDKRNGTSEVIEILPDKGRLSEKEIVEMIYQLNRPDVITID